MTQPIADERLVFLLDVDNTLLDNDRLKEDIGDGLLATLGPDRSERFWQLYEDIRHEKDVVDYPATVERLSALFPGEGLQDRLTTYLFGLPFRQYLFPHALETIQHLKRFGLVAILSDGDPVFQAWKIRQSGLQAMTDEVLIFKHKEQELPDVFARLPADHYVMVDDKPTILAALERHCPSGFTTILVLQGHYAEGNLTLSPEPDYVLPAIADLRSFDAAQFRRGATVE